MAVQLAERQFGFDALELGFPSIENCMAIVYVTPNGLYGFHNLGGNGELIRWQDKSFAFLNCMNKINARDVTKGTRLYGVTHFENRRHVPEELKTFAHTLGFTGTIEGFDCTGVTNGNGSAYVHFTKNGAGCDVSVQKWQPLSPLHVTKADANPYGANLISTKPGPGGNPPTTLYPSPQKPFISGVNPPGGLPLVTTVVLRA
jgi:hypothetical protein